MNHKENKRLLKSFLARTFFKKKSEQSQSDIDLFGNIELQLNSKCNLDCDYCYYKQGAYGKLLNPDNISTSINIKKNLLIFLEYLEDRKVFPNTITLFSGETLVQTIGYECIDIITAWAKQHYTQASPLRIMVPSNMSFLRSDKRTEQVSELVRVARSQRNANVCLSASVDGKYMDKKNRPLIGTVDPDTAYSDGYYDKLFSFAKAHNCGFHPMIHVNNIQQWKNNFIWFQEQFKKHNIPWHNIYLLEVRNDGWTKQAIQDFIDFHIFVLNYTLDKFNGDQSAFLNGFIFNGINGYPNYPKMNLFNNIGTIGRGLGCSLQTTLSLRLGDLSVNSCHRLSYEHFKGFHFEVIKKKITDIVPDNLNFYLSTMYTAHQTWPYCETCMIKHICNGGCMGAQYETIKDPFVPIPSVCALSFGKVKAQVLFLKSVGLFEDFVNLLNPKQSESFKQFEAKI